jgi:hypothetical protein
MMKNVSPNSGSFPPPVVIPQEPLNAGIKGWMPVGALFAGFAIFGLMLLAATGIGISSSQQQQTSNAPPEAQSQQQPQQKQQPAATTGSGTAQQPR